MEFTKTTIAGVFEIMLSSFADERGQFSRLFCQEELLRKTGMNRSIVQVNHSINKMAGTVRGLHFQYPPHAETKLIRCLKGRVFDVAVDVRKGSPTFLKWQAIELSPEKNNMICIPEGCAHGFQTMEADSELIYFHTAYYHPGSEGALRFDDPAIGITWPLDPVHVSEKDKNYLLLTDTFDGLTVGGSGK
jgi:dTDP-4-dehydrorhamnose 3,5-epimerase